MSSSEPVVAQQQPDHPAKRVKTASDDAPVPAAMEPCPPLQVKKLSDKARLPTRGSLFAAGYDIYAAKATAIPARGKALVDTDIAISVPAGTCTFGPRPSLCLFATTRS